MKRLLTLLFWIIAIPFIGAFSFIVRGFIEVKSMKKILLIAFLMCLVGCGNRKNDWKEFHRGVVFSADYYNKYDEYPSWWIQERIFENSNLSIDSLRKVNDSLSSLITELYDYYNRSDTFLIYKDTVLPSGSSFSGKGMGKTVYKLVDTLKDYPIRVWGEEETDLIINPDDSSWEISKQVPWPILVKDGKQFTATYDSLGNIYFTEK